MAMCSSGPPTHPKLGGNKTWIWKAGESLFCLLYKWKYYDFPWRYERKQSRKCEKSNSWELSLACFWCNCFSKQILFFHMMFVCVSLVPLPDDSFIHYAHKFITFMKFWYVLYELEDERTLLLVTRVFSLQTHPWTFMNESMDERVTVLDFICKDCLGWQTEFIQFRSETKPDSSPLEHETALSTATTSKSLIFMLASLLPAENLRTSFGSQTHRERSFDDRQNVNQPLAPRERQPVHHWVLLASRLYMT